MGLADMMGLEKIALVAWEVKRRRAWNIVEGGVTDLVPRSVFQTHPETKIYVDLEAASELTSNQSRGHQLRVGQQACGVPSYGCAGGGQAILKLTNKDYNDNGLSELITLYGSAYNVNIKISTTCNTPSQDGQEANRMPMILTAPSGPSRTPRR